MPSIWAIADLHLSFGVPNKEMDVFGPHWKNYTQRLEQHWRDKIKHDDLVLIAGDISWAMRLEEVKPDLEWIHQLPGTKVMIRGNHDYWWNSLKQMGQIRPPSIHFVQNNAFVWKGIGVAGARLWDCPGASFREFIDFAENPKANLTAIAPDQAENQKLWDREMLRLETSLKCLATSASHRLAMVHYPPLDAAMNPSSASLLLEKYQVEACVFGHLHNVKKGVPLFGEKNGVRYLLTACDYLDFKPVQVLSGV